MTTSNAPADAATHELDGLPKTAVKERPVNRTIRELQDQLANYADPVETKSEVEPKTKEDETWKKRYADLRRHVQKVESEKQKEVDEYKAQAEQLKAAANQPMPKTAEEFEDWKNRYPDIAQFIEIIADQKAGEKSSKLQEQLGEVTQKLAETEKEKAFATLKVLVPDLEDLVKTQEYRSWFNDQPMFVQEKLNTSDDPYEISYYMGIFKMTLTKPISTKVKSDPREVLNSSVKGSGVTPSKAPTKYLYTASQIDAESRRNPRWFETNEAAIDEAKRKGLVLDDMSKGNYINMV